MTRPRVYVIDFETAIDFPEDSLESERLCADFPFALDQYGRHVAPEIEAMPMQPYCPFRLDMWQLGKDLHEEFQVRLSHNFLQCMAITCARQTGLDEIDQLWLSLCAPVPRDRSTADGALQALDAYLRRTPCLDLHRKIPVLSST